MKIKGWRMDQILMQDAPKNTVLTTESASTAAGGQDVEQNATESTRKRERGWESRKTGVKV